MQKLKPEYAAAATELKAFDPSIVIGKVISGGLVGRWLGTPAWR